MLLRSVFTLFLFLLSSVSLAGPRPLLGGLCGAGLSPGESLLAIEQDLKKAGLRQISESISLWYKSNTLISVNAKGKMSFFNEYNWIENDKITGVAVDEHNVYFHRAGAKSDYLYFGLAQGTNYPNTFYGDRSRVEKLFLSHSVEEGLIHSGFTPLGNDFYIRENIVSDPSTPTETYSLIARVRGSKISQLFLESPITANKIFMNGDSFEIVGASSKMSSFTNKTRLAVRLRNLSERVEFDFEDGSVENPTLLAPLETYSLEKLGVAPPISPIHDAGGFLIGGVNSTETILNLKTLRGVSIEELESRLFPGDPDSETAVTGFLARNEKLLNEMAYANKVVIEKMGRSHEIVARELKLFEGVWKLGIRKVIYRDRAYNIRDSGTYGFQTSPFRDGTGQGGAFTIERINLNTNAVIAKLAVSPTAIAMIELYGFYEGRGVPYHVNIDSFFQVFNFLQKSKWAMFFAF